MNEPERCCGRPSERARCLVEGTPVARAVYCAPRSTAPAVRGGARGGRDEGGATRKAGALRAGEAPRGEPRAAAARKQTTERKRESRCGSAPPKRLHAPIGAARPRAARDAHSLDHDPRPASHATPRHAHAEPPRPPTRASKNSYHAHAETKNSGASRHAMPAAEAGGRCSDPPAPPPPSAGS